MKPQKYAYKVNLIRQHHLCETNYLRLLKLLPQLWSRDHHHLKVDFGSSLHGSSLNADVHFKVTQRSPYTTQLGISVQADWGQWLAMPELEVRLYHDVAMAEVIFRKRSQQLEPQYSYPNPNMHQPNEKELQNQFLSEFLNFCLQGGISSKPFSQ